MAVSFPGFSLVPSLPPSLIPFQMVEEQHRDEDVELLPPRMFRFDEKGPQAKLEVQFQRQIPSTGWILALESDSKVPIRAILS